MFWELFKEIYIAVLSSTFRVLIVIQTWLVLTYLLRLTIKFINDDEYTVNYFFTDCGSGWVKQATLGVNTITDEVVTSVFFGMIVIPVVYVILTLLWPAVLFVFCVYGLLLATRGSVRFKKKVEKHMEHTKHLPANNEYGFTLIELMIIITVISILIIIDIHHFSNNLPM